MKVALSRGVREYKQPTLSRCRISVGDAGPSLRQPSGDGGRGVRLNSGV